MDLVFGRRHACESFGIFSDLDVWDLSGLFLLWTS